MVTALNATGMALSDVNETLTAVGGLAAGVGALIVALSALRDRRRRGGGTTPPPPEDNAPSGRPDSGSGFGPSGPTPS
ncbi:hypothetical protein [Streptomyces sp. VRA16 Mangrove soil]|uniref:hypothetical protein n=1 Tax=Streptomyces sp. VRA16 Mangrove soil TaxID=2817434 RepID=UPI001A9DF98F|nr:hypothetical protein [Streptomyces sp. VRA16 Mangrove soil]MBO1335764.1 hypothetical protein [Streptomyces sp. VRA16 Mangrove soil]